MIKDYPVLYAKDSVGNTRTWYCRQEGHKFYTVAGIKGGAQVAADPTECKAMNVGRANETTPIQQATLEIEALYKKKLKLKYFKDEKDIDKKNYFAPMLAKGLEEYEKKLVFPLIVQVKLNGARCIATKDGLHTRKGEVYVSIPHISEDLKPVFDKYPDAVFDGELFNHDLRQKLNELMSLVRKSKNVTPEELRQSRAMVQYHCYDGFLSPEMQEECYTVRQEALNKALAGTKYYRPVESHLVNSRGMIDHIYKKFLEDGQEGAMVRILKQGYENKRSKYLLKYKPEEDDEGTIIAVHDGTGNWSGAATTCTLRTKKYGEFDATFKGCYEDRAKILKNKKDWINKEVTYLFMGLTGLNTPNYARIDISNCFKK